MTGPSPKRTIALSELQAGQSGRLLPVQLDDARSASGADDQADAGDALAARLANLGFVPGTEFRAIRCAPFGGPIELEIRGYRICLRRQDLSSLHAVIDEASERGPDPGASGPH